MRVRLTVSRRLRRTSPVRKPPITRFPVRPATSFSRKTEKTKQYVLRTHSGGSFSCRRFCFFLAVTLPAIYSGERRRSPAVRSGHCRLSGMWCSLRRRRCGSRVVCTTHSCTGRNCPTRLLRRLKYPRGTWPRNRTLNNLRPASYGFILSR